MELEGVAPQREGGVPMELHTDSDDLVKRVKKLTFDAGLKKRRKTDIADVQECIDLGVLRHLVKIAGPGNPIDCYTKEMSFDTRPYQRLCELMREGWYRIEYG